MFIVAEILLKPHTRPELLNKLVKFVKPEPMLIQCWLTVYDVSPTLVQHCFISRDCWVLLAFLQMYLKFMTVLFPTAELNAFSRVSDGDCTGNGTLSLYSGVVAYECAVDCYQTPDCVAFTWQDAYPYTCILQDSCDPFSYLDGHDTYVRPDGGSFISLTLLERGPTSDVKI